MDLSGAVLGMLPKVLVTGDGRLLAGDTARFLKGLLEGKFVVSPGDICLADSVGANEVSASLGRRVKWAGERFSWPISYR